jgi:hypothetical protein
MPVLNKVVMIFLYCFRSITRRATSPTRSLRACGRSWPKTIRSARPRRRTRRPPPPPRPPESRPSFSSRLRKNHSARARGAAHGANLSAREYGRAAQFTYAISALAPPKVEDALLRSPVLLLPAQKNCSVTCCW